MGSTAAWGRWFESNRAYWSIDGSRNKFHTDREYAWVCGVADGTRTRDNQNHKIGAWRSVSALGHPKLTKLRTFNPLPPSGSFRRARRSRCGCPPDGPISANWFLYIWAVASGAQERGLEPRRGFPQQVRNGNGLLSRWSRVRVTQGPPDQRTWLPSPCSAPGCWSGTRCRRRPSIEGSRFARRGVPGWWMLTVSNR